MRNFYTFISILSILLANAQIGTSQFNNTKISANNDGTFFHFQAFTPQGYLVPASEDKGTIHSSSIWLSSKDVNNTEHLSAVVLSDFGTDFTSGPISSNQSSTTQFYNGSVYTTDIFDLNDHKKNPSSNVSSIYGWPVKGDISRGEPNTIAPYVDLNGDNIYQPEDGEYPVIYGDKCMYSIFNDQANQGFSRGSSMGLDVHQYIYQLAPRFDGDTLENTNFARFMIVNRSENDYSDFKFGIYVNIGIGNFRDDYVGSDSTLNLSYGYNGDDNDEGIAGYGLNPPMQGALLLNTPLATSTSILQSNDPTEGLPSNANEYLNYLNGKRRDGSAKTTSGGNLSYTSQFDYPGNLNNEDDFTEKDFGKTPGDRNLLMVAKPAYIAAGDTLIYDLAFPFVRVNFGGNTGAYDSLIRLSNHIINRYNSNYSWIEKAGDNRGTVGVTKQVKTGFTVYPNPSTGQFTIKGLKTDKQSVITNLAGQTLKTIEANMRTIDLSEFETGVYFLQTEVRSVRLIKI